MKPQEPVREPMQQRTLPSVDAPHSTLSTEQKRQSEPVSTPKVEPPPFRAQDKGKEPLTSFTLTSSRAPSAGSMTPQQANGEAPGLSRPRSPRTAAMTVSTPKSPQGHSPLPGLPAKPQWGATPGPQAPTTYFEPPADSPGAVLGTLKQELRDKFQITPLDGPHREALSEVRLRAPCCVAATDASWCPQIARINVHQRHLQATHHAAEREVRKALWELEMADLEVESLSRKRELTVKQLTLAEASIPGAEWPGSQELDDVQA